MSDVVEEGKSKLMTALSGFGLMKERKNNDNKKNWNEKERKKKRKKERKKSKWN